MHHCIHCNPAPWAAVGAAVKQLVGIRVPADTSPGHVGGGPIGQDLFLECKSSSEYPMVGHLQAQENKVCFQATFSTCTDTPATPVVASQGLSVDYSSETAEGLVLCPNDNDPSTLPSTVRELSSPLTWPHRPHAAIVCFLFAGVSGVLYATSGTSRQVIRNLLTYARSS